ncbi:hypothetical protein MBLNU459_g7750t1 [Dothideomycetes sp. NU459]
MFASHRPVPSKAALRVLRQLAYISSGTACGAAALVAEERRRKTCLAKKIVDNTRQLKRHPRHARTYSHAATATRNDDDALWLDGQDATDANTTSHSSRRSALPKQELGNASHAEAADVEAQRTRRISNNDNNDHNNNNHGVHPQVDKSLRRIRAEPDAFRSSQLPSEVDKGYRKLTRRDRLRRHQREEALASRTRGHMQYGSSRPINGNVEPLLRGPFAESKNETLLRLGGATSTRETQTLKLNDLVATEPASQDSIRVREINDSVRQFLELRLGLDRIKPSHVIRASRLLHMCINANILDTTKIMYGWLLHTGKVDVKDVKALCLQAPTMFAHNDFFEVKRFYEESLLDRRLQHLERKSIIYGSIFVTAAMLDASMVLSLDTELPLYHPLARQFPALVQDQLHQCCIDLIKQGRSRAASRVFLHCTHKLENSDINVSLVKQLLEATLTDGMISQSHMLLQVLDDSHYQIKPYLLWLYNCCVSTQSYGSLIRLHKKYAARFPFPPKLYEALFTAYAQSNQWKLAESPIWDCERPKDDSILSACQPAWATYIRRMTKSTGNLNLAKDTFAKMCNMAGEGRVGIEVYNSIIYACVTTGHNDVAKHFLRQMQDCDGIQPDLTTFGYFVLSAAKVQDWPAVENLLMFVSALGDRDAPRTQRVHLFNPVLQEYIRSHTSEEIWTFTSRAIDIHGVVPNQTTSDIVVASFVRGRSLDLVSHWLKYMSICGLEVEFTARTARDMMRSFYYHERPYHAHVLGLFRSLTRFAPDLMSKDMLLLARDAITYDIRHMRGSGGHRKVAEARLSSLEQADTFFPRKISRIGHGWEARERKLLAEQQARQLTERQRKVSPLLSAVNTNMCDDGLTLEGLSGTKVAEPDKLPAYGIIRRVQSKATAAKDNSTSSQPLQREDISHGKKESDMLLSLSIGRPADVVRFYKSVLVSRGLSRSSISLELAIQASIKAQHGQTLEAEEILADAEKAGYNVFTALTPLLIQRMQGAKDGNGLNVANLRQTVTKFYEEMVINNVPIKHHIVTTAASVLCKAGKPAEGASLLKTIFKSDWAQGPTPYDLAALTVWLQCYIKLWKQDGIDWVMDHVLRHDMRIDTALVHTLRWGLHQFRMAHKHTGSDAARTLHLRLRDLHQHAKARHAHQKRDAMLFGRRLVGCIVKCARPPRPVDAAAFAEIRAAEKVRLQQRGAVSARRRRGAAAAAAAAAVKMPPPMHEHQWKALLRRGLLDEDGRMMRFRYKDVTGKSRRHRSADT